MTWLAKAEAESVSTFLRPLRLGFHFAYHTFSLAQSPWSKLKLRLTFAYTLRLQWDLTLRQGSMEWGENG